MNTDLDPRLGYCLPAASDTDLTPPTPRERAIAALRREAIDCDGLRCLQLAAVADALEQRWHLDAPAITLLDLIEHFRRRDPSRALRLEAVREIVEAERTKARAS